MTLRDDAMSLDAMDAADAAAIADILSLASAVAGGEGIALVDADGHVVAGRTPAAGVDRATRPLVRDGHAFGAVVGPGSGPPELLALVARSLELAMADADERAQRARMGEELAIGRRIQMALLPRQFPDVAGWRFAAAYEPARAVGGDLYDAFGVRGRKERLGLTVADVTGKGIPAALLMADVRALLHAATDSSTGPADALSRVNQILVHERATALMVTAVLLVLETRTGRVRYSGAGHEPPLVARAAGGIEPFDACGVILGLNGTSAYTEQQARLMPGDALVLYTDGVTDARDRDGRFYGEERLREVIRASCGQSADAMVRMVIDDVSEFRGEADPYDDIALLVVERLRG